MGQDKDANTLDASIAGEVDICNIRANETVNLDFIIDDEGDEWGGNYEFIVYNSPKKNTSDTKTNAVQANAETLTLTVIPETQNIEVGKHYYEIFDTTIKRVEFYGVLEILD